jgi:hypothetical protein
MSRTRAFITGGIGTVALLAAGTLPAFAGTTSDTETTFTLDAGTIDIAVQADASLTDAYSGAPFITGTLGDVTVTDGRGGTVGWTASAKSSAFLRAGGITTASTAVRYNSGTVDKTGSVTADSLGTKTLAMAAPTPVVTGTAVTGNNTATWNPTLTVDLPSDSLAGDYTGTVTTSVA